MWRVVGRVRCGMVDGGGYFVIVSFLNMSYDLVKEAWSWANEYSAVLVVTRTVSNSAGISEITLSFCLGLRGVLNKKR